MSERALIVTGATGGLGTEVVRSLVRDYRCIALYHSKDGFDELREALGGGDNLEGLPADLSIESNVREAIRKAAAGGPIYGLVHLAGGYASGSVSETTTETWSKMIGLNLTSAFLAIRETLAVMDRTKPGRIIAISSEAARTRAGGSAAYTVSKSGLSLLVELLAEELNGTPITANAIEPASLDTPAMRKSMDRSKLVPLSRVVDTISFLLSDAGASVSGARVPLRP